MKSSEQSLALPLDYASELSFELHLMRGECSEAARKLMAHHPVDEKGLEDCAVLDDALAQAKRLLDCALESGPALPQKKNPALSLMLLRLASASLDRAPLSP